MTFQQHKQQRLARGHYGLECSVQVHIQYSLRTACYTSYTDEKASSFRRIVCFTKRSADGWPIEIMPLAEVLLEGVAVRNMRQGQLLLFV